MLFSALTPAYAMSNSSFSVFKASSLEGQSLLKDVAFPVGSTQPGYKAKHSLSGDLPYKTAMRGMPCHKSGQRSKTRAETDKCLKHCLELYDQQEIYLPGTGSNYKFDKDITKSVAWLRSQEASYLTLNTYSSALATGPHLSEFGARNSFANAVILIASKQLASIQRLRI